MELEDLQPKIAARGILPEPLVTVVNVQWYVDRALELTHKDPAGSPRRRTLSTIFFGVAANVWRRSAAKWN